WICRACRRTFRTAVPNAPPPPDQEPQRHDLYTLNDDAFICHSCGEASPLRSNAAVAEETERISKYLQPRPGPSCPVETCPNHGRPVDAAGATAFYQRFGTSDGGSTRFRCKACRKLF